MALIERLFIAVISYSWHYSLLLLLLMSSCFSGSMLTTVINNAIHRIHCVLNRLETIYCQPLFRRADWVPRAQHALLGAGLVYTRTQVLQHFGWVVGWSLDNSLVRRKHVMKFAGSRWHFLLFHWHCLAFPIQVMA